MGSVGSMGDVALACMRAFVDELARRGVTDACVSPGSRSTPLALALARDERLRVHVILDERASSFFALGLAKATGRPVVVACTSGTAAANMLPAVVEARQSGAPLLVLTADRPPELRGTGANQTIDQLELYGRYPRLFADALVPSIERLGEFRALGARAIAACWGEPAEPPAPVHVNLPFAEPLTPSGAEVDIGGPLVPTDARGPALESLCAAEAKWTGARVAATERGVIVAGTLAGGADGVLALAEASGWPLLAEPISGARRGRHALAGGQLLLGDPAWAGEHVPDLVLHVGGIPTTRAAQALCASASSVVSVSVFAREPTPGWRLDRMITTDPGAFCRALAARIPAVPETGWAGEWHSADAIARAAVDALLDDMEEPFEGRVARDVAATLPDGATLFVGSSTPVRDLDVFMRPRDGLLVLGNRGASGIDGTVSTVLGIAAAGEPTVGLVGDLAVLHDMSGLLWASTLGLDAVLVVLNNRGGGIFDLLPSASLPEHERLFVTPHDVDLANLGVAHERVGRGGEVVPAIEGARAAGGVRIVEVPIDRARALDQRRAVAEAVRAALV